MGYQQEVFSLIAQLGGSKNKVVVDHTLCKFMGGLAGGAFLSQLLYWCDKGSNPAWFYKTYKEWEEETFLSEYEVRKFSKECVEMGFLETTIRKANGNPTVHYKLDPAKFMDAILGFVENGNLKISVSIPEILQEPYTENTTESKRYVVPAEQPPLFAETASSADAVPLPVALGFPIAEPPKTMTPHVSMMLVLSGILLGHRDHPMWTDAQRKMLGSAAKKLLGLGWSPLNVERWHHSQWPKHWAAAKGGRPNNNQLMEGLAQWKAESDKPSGWAGVTVQSMGDWKEEDYE